MRPNKKYLRTKIVYNFFTDVCTVINRYITSNTIILNNGYTKIHAN